MSADLKRKISNISNILSECSHGKHDFIPAYRSSVDCDAEEIVRWCQTCGSIVVDLDYDGRTFPGKIMRLKSPLLAKHYN
jgi:hypothetical protein